MCRVTQQGEYQRVCSNCRHWEGGTFTATQAGFKLVHSEIDDWGRCSMPERPSAGVICRSDLILANPTMLDPQQSLVGSSTPLVTHHSFGCLSFLTRDHTVNKDKKPQAAPSPTEAPNG